MSHDDIESYTLLKNSDHTRGSSGLSPLIHCSILYHSGCFHAGFFSHSQRGGYTKDSSDMTHCLSVSTQMGMQNWMTEATRASGTAIMEMAQLRLIG